MSDEYHEWLKRRCEMSELSALQSGDSYAAVSHGVFLVCLVEFERHRNPKPIAQEQASDGEGT